MILLGYFNMNPEQFLDREIVYTKELQALKMSLQSEVIKVFCESDRPSGAEVLQWIDDYSKHFRAIFEERMREDDFLIRCNNPEERKVVVGEIVASLKKIEV
jgi:hypothetical protein